MPDQTHQDRSEELFDPQLQCELRGTRIVADDEPVYRPLVVPQTTCLGNLKTAIGEQFGVFVTDEAGQVVGLVHTDEILERLNAGHPRERERWSDAPISSLLLTRISVGESNEAQERECFERATAILEQGRMIGIATPDDVLLSWKFIQPALRKAAVDPLTGLINRANFERRLGEEWDRSQRLGQSIGVVLCDIDRFKQVNDNFGHQFGDRVVQTIATTLERSLRSYDVVSRFGGDEFVCLCLGCGPRQIAIPIRRIQRQLEALVHVPDHEAVRVTTSFGAAVCHAGFDRQNPYNLVEAADQCLYQAKSHGRSRGYFVDFEDAHRFRDTTNMVPVPPTDEATKPKDFIRENMAI